MHYGCYPYLTSAIPIRVRTVTNSQGNSSGSAAVQEIGINNVRADTAARHKANSHFAPYISASLRKRKRRLFLIMCINGLEIFEKF